MPNYYSSLDDQFFMPLNDHYWLPHVDNVQRLLLPNADHSMLSNIGFVLIGVAGHINTNYDKSQEAQLSWKMLWSNNTLVAFISPKPARLMVWRAETPKFSPPRADWRSYTKPNDDGTCTSPTTKSPFLNLCDSPVQWSPIELDPVPLGSDKYAAAYTEQHPPTDGNSWVGYFIFAFWAESDTTRSQILTTQMMSAPGQFPYEDCLEVGNCSTDTL